MGRFTLKEVAAHNTSTSCWIVLNGVVFDVTTFLDDHPGGYEILLHHAGKDATDAFEAIGHSESALEVLNDYSIGLLETPRI